MICKMFRKIISQNLRKEIQKLKLKEKIIIEKNVEIIRTKKFETMPHDVYN